MTSKELSSWRPSWSRRCSPFRRVPELDRQSKQSHRLQWQLSVRFEFEFLQVARAVGRDPVEVQELNLAEGMQKAREEPAAAAR